MLAKGKNTGPLDKQNFAVSMCKSALSNFHWVFSFHWTGNTVEAACIHRNSQKSTRLICIMGCIWTRHKLLAKESHKAKRWAIASDSASHPHITAILISSQPHQHTFLHGHLTCHLVDAVKTADLTIHAGFPIQYSSIKQTDILPIYDRYGLGSENISTMMQVTK